MIRVLVVGGSAAGRAGLEAMLAGDRELEVIGRSGAAMPGADVIVEGGDGDGGDGGRAPRVVVVELLDRRAVARALRAGARVVLGRDAEPEELRAGVRAAAAGLAAVPAEMAAALRVTATRAARPDTAGQPLTGREVDVLRMLAEGAGNRRIAERLGISAHTVKFHLAAIFAKLDVTTRTEAVTVGLRRGLIML